MDIAVETFQAFLDDAWEAAPQQANTLRDQLRAYEKQCSSQFETVGTIGSVAKNSTSQSYRGPGLGSYTIAQIQTAWRGLINLFYQTKEKTDWLNANEQWFQQKYPQYGGDPDQAVYDFAARWLREDFTSYESDFTELRLKPTLAGEGVRTW